jgi:hypothetical protein
LQNGATSSSDAAAAVPDGIALFAHIPLVGLRDTGPVFVNYGFLTELDYDNWAMFEGHGALEWESYYDSPRTFFHLRFRNGDPLDQRLPTRAPDEHLASGADFAWYLLILSAGVFLPHPALSASYVGWVISPSEQLVHKVHGYCDNDLLRQRPQFFLRSEDADPLLANARKLHLNAGHNLIVDRLLAPYRRLINPVPDPNRIFSLVSLLEQLMNPDAREHLGRRFAARLVDINAASDDPTAIDTGYELGRRLYELRSCVIHGHGVSKCMGRLFDAFGDVTSFPVELLSAVICRLVSLETADLTSEHFPRLLADMPVRADPPSVRRFVEKLPATFLQSVGVVDGG